MSDSKGVEPIGLSEDELTVVIAGLHLAGYRTVEIERDTNSFHCKSLAAKMPQWRQGVNVTEETLIIRDYREWIDWEHARIARSRERESRRMNAAKAN